ncbi:hypothetical protein TNCV_976041 [Trichonephila clavipes]|nr:hypothetical protein TNCV_976041 [Trichonephila clavipes]
MVVLLMSHFEATCDRRRFYRVVGPLETRSVEWLIHGPVTEWYRITLPHHRSGVLSSGWARSTQAITPSVG